MGRIHRILDTPPAIRDESPAEVTGVRGEVEFRRLSFAYEGGPTVLHEIDLKVPAGAEARIRSAWPGTSGARKNRLPVAGNTVSPGGADDASASATPASIAQPRASTGGSITSLPRSVIP